ncbi:MAG: hypothetical protein FWD73_13945 [Polyangiaceae bacterium]|nr:hypothetical protein [Polyangiaceae bacterium]
MSDEGDEKHGDGEAKDAADANSNDSPDNATSDAENVTPEDVDEANPEAIARRVAALGDDDPLESRAREEERKLAERRTAAKATKKAGKAGKKSGLEVAASKKLAKIGTRAEPRRRLAVSADADPLLARTEKLGDWARKNQKVVQVVAGALAVAVLGIVGFRYYDNRREIEASVLLAKAVADERGHIGEPPKDEAARNAMGPTFNTFDERRDAALSRFREVETKFPKTGAAILARLAEGSLLLDKRDANGAFAAFDSVRNSPLAAVDKEVKGRSIEGIGFAYELKADANAADAPKYLDDALRAYKDLEGTDVRGFKELAMYHQARVAEKKGDKDKAREILLALKESFSKPGDSVANLPSGAEFPYLSEVAMDRLRMLDPTAMPKSGED